MRIGLNPYGLTYTTGLQPDADGTANPKPVGVDGFVSLAQELGADCVELDSRWVLTLDRTGRETLAARIAGGSGGTDPPVVILSHGLSQQADESLAEPIGAAAAIGARLLRMHVTPALEGARARHRARWSAWIDHARTVLIRDAAIAADAGIALAVEDHQDLGSDDLLMFHEATAGAVGVVLDTGNPFAVAEDPVAFTTRVAPLVKHLHLKDYRAQFTDEGFRLVRCVIGDGAVPFEEMLAVFEPSTLTSMTASVEPGAHQSRHIRLYCADWWTGYPARRQAELATAIDRLKKKALDKDADVRTPWGRKARPSEIVAFEMDQVRASFTQMRERLS